MQENKEFQNQSPILINKPVGLSSMDVIRKLRKELNIKKIGHAGTLDPMASGLLIICAGKDTKKINEFMNLPKEYVTEIKLGEISQSGDSEGPISKYNVKKIPELNIIKEVIKKFVGKIKQKPPIYSALKINGIPAYKLAREGKKVEIDARVVKIDKIEILNYEWPILKIKVNCQKGVYIRSLAQDIGSELNTGGYVLNLVRTAIGNFKLENAKKI